MLCVDLVKLSRREEQVAPLGEEQQRASHQLIKLMIVLFQQHFIKVGQSSINIDCRESTWNRRLMNDLGLKTVINARVHRIGVGRHYVRRA
jgi:hypothetical protein